MAQQSLQTFDNQGVFTIPLHADFLEDLAAHLVHETRKDPLYLRHYTIFLPTRRSLREFRHKLLKFHGGPSLILPRLLPLDQSGGDFLEFSLDFTHSENATEKTEKRLLSSGKRQVMMAKLIKASGTQGFEMSTPQALHLASSLTGLMDHTFLEGLDIKDLETLVAEDYAEHWQITLDFLKILTVYWPKILEENQYVEGAWVRRSTLLAILKHWTQTPPAHPVILGGSMGTLRLTRDLMKGILKLPQGRIVFPGFDPLLFEESLEHPSHPHHTLSYTVKDLGLAPADVRPWPGSSFQENPLISLGIASFKPFLSPVPEKNTLPPLRLLECQNEMEEAASIALLIREGLQDPHKTLLFITPDLNLSRSVLCHLRRWDLEVTPSSGIPLGETSPGILLRTFWEFLSNPSSAVLFLSLLKHPLVRFGLSLESMNTAVNRLDKHYCRPMPYRAFSLKTLWETVQERDLQTILAKLLEIFHSLTPHHGHGPMAASASASSASAPSPTNFRAPSPSPALRDFAASNVFPDFLNLESLRSDTAFPVGPLVSLTETFLLRMTTNEAGHSGLFEGEAGEALKAFFQEIKEFQDVFPPTPLSQYPGVLDVLLRDRQVRFPVFSHPRIRILGTLEARLLNADRVILGGLNEGTWPGTVETGPWLSRPMREAFGLRPLEQRIGLAAHDFLNTFSAKEVYLTRSVKVQGTPTLPCRWILRLETILKNHPQWKVPAVPYQAMARDLDQPSHFYTLPPPEPRPPVSQRPRNFSVSDVELWMRDPYALYARRILRLQKLPVLGGVLNAADRGTLIHTCLEAYVQESQKSQESQRSQGGNQENQEEQGPQNNQRIQESQKSQKPLQGEASLMALGRHVFDPFWTIPGIQQFWWPQFLNMVPWFVAHYKACQPVKSYSEHTGHVVLGNVTLKAKVDRLDQTPDNSYILVDYKTGMLPSETSVRLGYSPQLPLEGLILQAGGFGVPVHAQAEISLHYWGLWGKGDKLGELKALKNPQGLIQEAREGFQKLVRLFNLPSTPYLCKPRPQWAPAFSCYDHLSRIQEWAGDTPHP